MSESLPVYLVRGSDLALRNEALHTLVHDLVGDGDAGLMVEDFDFAEDADPGAIVDAARTPPFLTGRRIVVARDVTNHSTDALAVIIDYLDDPSPTTSLVLVAANGEQGPKGPKALADAVKKVGHVIDASIPGGRGRSMWLQDHLKGAPVRLDGAALKAVDEHLGEDLGRLTNLLESLAAAYGAGSKVSVDEVEPFLGEAGGVPPWELTDAIDSGDIARGLTALHRMMAAGGRHPLQIMATLHGHFANMLRLDGLDLRNEAEAAQVLGMKKSTYPAKKAMDQGRKLGHDGVSRAIQLIADADLTFRGLGKSWPEDITMEVLVARLCRLVPAKRR
ncbi:MAG: polymerase subunit delta [Actinomycetota bacterium]|jgi:DNA polymerase-3 subunit delta|nr:polymerase subunit delta [Actinomycetota bacterium]